VFWPPVLIKLTKFSVCHFSLINLNLHDSYSGSHLKLLLNILLYPAPCRVLHSAHAYDRVTLYWCIW